MAGMIGSLTCTNGGLVRVVGTPLLATLSSKKSSSVYAVFRAMVTLASPKIPPLVAVNVAPTPGPMSSRSQLGGCCPQQIKGSSTIKFIQLKSEGRSPPLEFGLFVIARYPGN